MADTADPVNYGYSNLLSKFQTIEKTNKAPKKKKSKRKINKTDDTDTTTAPTDTADATEPAAETAGALDTTPAETTEAAPDTAEAGDAATETTEAADDPDAPDASEATYDAGTSEPAVDAADEPEDAAANAQDATDATEAADASAAVEEAKDPEQEEAANEAIEDNDDIVEDPDYNKEDEMAAEDDAATQTIEEWLEDNKLLNSEVLSILKANNVENEEDLKTFFEEADDLAGVVKSVRKRTEKQLAGFVKKINELAGLDYEYRPPRHRAKQASNMGDSSARKNSGLNVSSRRSRTGSNSSNGSVGSTGSFTYKKKRGQPTPTGKELAVEANANNSYQLKQWLQRKNIFHNDLFSYLANHGYQQKDDLEVLTEKEFDRIVREVRVETFKAVNDSKKRQRVDKLLVKFEKEWRELSGLRKTNMTKEQQEAWGYSPRTASQRAMDDADEDGGFFDDEEE